MRHAIPALLLSALTLTASCKSDDEPVPEPVSLTSELTDLSPDSVALNSRSRYMVVVGDIQEYTNDNSRMHYLLASMQWMMLQQSFFGNIDLVVQVGDITNDNEAWQWENGLIAMTPVAERIPAVWVPGNHDYRWLRREDRYLFIDSHAATPFSVYPLPVHRSMTVEAAYEPGKRDNAIYSVMLGGRPAYIVALEFAPRPAVVGWAGDFIASHQDTDCWLVTHEWLWQRKGRLKWEDSYAAMQFERESEATAPEDIWRRIVEPNDNVIAVICGHNDSYYMTETPNRAGRRVLQAEFNLQYLPNGGDSQLQLWEMPAGSDSVHVSVYNTLAREFVIATGASRSFSRARASLQ